MKKNESTKKDQDALKSTAKKIQEALKSTVKKADTGTKGNKPNYENELKKFYEAQHANEQFLLDAWEKAFEMYHKKFGDKEIIVAKRTKDDEWKDEIEPMSIIRSDDFAWQTTEILVTKFIPTRCSIIVTQYFDDEECKIVDVHRNELEVALQPDKIANFITFLWDKLGVKY